MPAAWLAARPEAKRGSMCLRIERSIINYLPPPVPQGQHRVRNGGPQAQAIGVQGWVLDTMSLDEQHAVARFCNARGDCHGTATCPAAVFVHTFGKAGGGSRLALPDKASISRWRVCLDAAYMLWYRRHCPAGHCVRYFMVDSSTQGGRDYELLVVCSVAHSQLADLYGLANELIILRWAPGSN
eukprot:16441673-Heterocapsa_arctica.AAC.1